MKLRSHKFLRSILATYTLLCINKFLVFFAQIKMPYILTTTVKLHAQGVQRTPPIKVYRHKEPTRVQAKQTTISGHSYKVVDVSTNHDNNNKRMPV